jgi:hypothetical protein
MIVIRKARINGINKRGNSVFSALELVWQRNVTTFICMLAMACL